MVRYYCDCCGNELKNRDGERIAGRVKVGDAEVPVEVMSGLGSTWNAGHVCHRCQVTAIMALLDAYPQPMASAKAPENVTTFWTLQGAAPRASVVKIGKD